MKKSQFSNSEFCQTLRTITKKEQDIQEQTKSGQWHVGVDGRVVVAKRNNSCWRIGVIVVCFYRDSVPSAYMMSFIKEEGSEMPQLPCEVTENVKQHRKQDNWLNVNPASTGIRTFPESKTTLESDTHAHTVSDAQEDKMGTAMIQPSQSCHFSQSTGTQRGPRETKVARQSIP